MLYEEELYQARPKGTGLFLLNDTITLHSKLNKCIEPGESMTDELICLCVHVQPHRN